MHWTAIDLAHKKLPKALRGYRPSEVDDLLRQVADELEKAARDRAHAEEQIEALRAEVGRYKGMEDTLNNAILLAQKTADELRATAHKDAELVIREAHQKARGLLDASALEREQVLADIRRLSQRRTALLDSLRGAARSLSEWMESQSWGGQPEQEELEHDSARPVLTEVSEDESPQKHHDGMETSQEAVG